MTHLGYEYLDDLAIADAQFRAWGDDLDALFRSAADATMNLMVEDLASIAPRVERVIELENAELDMLLFNFLQALIYHKDAEGLLLRVPELHVQPVDGNYRLTAAAVGETIDRVRHVTGVDIKAVTLHRFSLQREPDGWSATAILDV